MSINRTILSAGLPIRAMLLGNAELGKMVTKIYPIFVKEAILPYIVYNRVSLMQDVTKSGGADTANIDVDCYAASYEESIKIAEIVRSTLEFQTGEQDGVRIRRCFLVDSTEAYADDAFLQRLRFQVKI